jgi:hypothetical protein
MRRHGWHRRRLGYVSADHFPEVTLLPIPSSEWIWDLHNAAGLIDVDCEIVNLGL